ncbi:tetratricopeptide repeat protein [Streptomyces sp. YC419]|uniref:Tetratricopeptide repeat protein n=2 Tax=Streptomyces ureilyticus TaxID=1775131 RepID=A0ABX0DYV6_9ACTN|nr:tetratricopeptide repeat protein [Streptomyces ureilyticus]
MANLAMAYRLKNSLSQARELNEESRAVLINSLGENHPWTLGVTYNLAIDLRMGDLPQESSALLEDTAERAGLTLGERHPMTLLSQLASSLERDPLHGKAHPRSARDEILSMLAQTLGAQHRLTLTAHAGRCSVWTFDPLPI